MAAVEGLRARKKRHTEAAIRAAAIELFAARGFEAVPVVEIARRSGVSEATFYNYFPAKEDVILRGVETFEANLLTAVRDRRADLTLIDAFREFLLGAHGLLDSSDTAQRRELMTTARIIHGSPTLKARERQIYDDATKALADAIMRSGLGSAPTGTGRVGDQVAAWVIANALVGVHRALVGYVREGLLAGTSQASLRRGVRNRADRGLRIVEHGVTSRNREPRESSREP